MKIDGRRRGAVADGRLRDDRRHEKEPFLLHQPVADVESPIIAVVKGRPKTFLFLRLEVQAEENGKNQD